MDLKPSGPAPDCVEHLPRICAAETAIDAGLRSTRPPCVSLSAHRAGRWRDECMFMAERLHKSAETERCSDNLALAHAGQFNHHCLQRIIDTFASSAPPADSPHGWQLR